MSFCNEPITHGNKEGRLNMKSGYIMALLMGLEWRGLKTCPLSRPPIVFRSIIAASSSSSSYSCFFLFFPFFQRWEYDSTRFSFVILNVPVNVKEIMSVASKKRDLFINTSIYNSYTRLGFFLIIIKPLVHSFSIFIFKTNQVS